MATPDRVRVMQLIFTISIDGTTERRHINAHTSEADTEPIDIGWYAPVGEAFAVHGPGDSADRIAVCADDSRALMTLVREFAQAVLDNPDTPGDDDDD